MATTTLFAVPFVIMQHPQPEPLNTQLRELFLLRESEGERHANPNPYTVRNAQLFESHFDIFQWPEPCIGQLANFCLTNVMRTVAELNGYGMDVLQKIDVATDAWFH
ncbi:MAG: hypothetical protein JSS03_09640, partial [Proteobacteria bacterium]|nr:hypothetical protein [Pseudomonadota bacterium]